MGIGFAVRSEIGAPSLPTNILLAPSLPLTNTDLPSAGQAQNNSQPATTGGTNNGITPQGTDACLSDDNDTTTNVAGLPCGTPGTVFIIDCPT